MWKKKCKKASQINPRRSILTIRMNHVMHMCGYVIRGSNFKTGIKVRKAKHTDLGRGINTGCLTFARIFLSKVLSKSMRLLRSMPKKGKMNGSHTAMFQTPLYKRLFMRILWLVVSLNLTSMLKLPTSPSAMLQFMGTCQLLWTRGL